MKIDVISVALSGVMIAVTAVLYPRLPAQIPVHFGLTGQPDRWGPPYMIFLPPVIALVVGAIQMTNAEGSDLQAARNRARLVTLVVTVLQIYVLWKTLAYAA